MVFSFLWCSPRCSKCSDCSTALGGEGASLSTFQRNAKLQPWVVERNSSQSKHRICIEYVSRIRMLIVERNSSQSKHRICIKYASRIRILMYQVPPLLCTSRSARFFFFLPKRHRVNFVLVPTPLQFQVLGCFFLLTDRCSSLSASLWLT